MAERDPITIRLVRHGPLLPFLLGLALGLPLMAMPFFMQRAPTTDDWVISVGGGVLAVLFGAVVFFWPMLDRRPRLILSDSGLRMPRKTGVLIPWKNVVGVHHRPKRGKHAAVVQIEVRDMELPPPGRVSQLAGKGFGGVLSFWPVWLEGDWWAVRDAIRTMAPEVRIEG